jgi:hypothetical protein
MKDKSYYSKSFVIKKERDMDMDPVVKVLNGSCSVVPCPKV